jgi:hypothetical protein
MGIQAICRRWGKELFDEESSVARASRITYPGAFCHLISRGVELVFTEDELLARDVKMYLCQRHSDKKLKEIGVHFGIGESGV